MFGGIGYLEDTNIPVLHRDAQVLSIWEGTTNVLSLDMLRAIEKENGLPAFIAFANNKLDTISEPKLRDIKQQLTEKLNTLLEFIDQLPSKEDTIGSSRDVAFYIAELTIGVLWLEFIQKCPKEKYYSALNYWMNYKIKEHHLSSYKIMQQENTLKNVE